MTQTKLDKYHNSYTEHVKSAHFKKNWHVHRQRRSPYVMSIADGVNDWSACTFWIQEAIKLCTCCIESMERWHTDGRDDCDDSFLVTVPSSSPIYVKSQPKVLVVDDG
jgi:hypothetical protein